MLTKNFSLPGAFSVFNFLRFVNYDGDASFLYAIKQFSVNQKYDQWRPKSKNEMFSSKGCFTGTEINYVSIENEKRTLQILFEIC